MYVIKMGEAYDPKTLDVLWPTPRKFPMFPWAKASEVAVSSDNIGFLQIRVNNSYQPFSTLD
jgi:hypothetical protein